MIVTEVWPRLSGEAREELTKRMMSRDPCGEWCEDDDRAGGCCCCRCC